MERKGLFFAFEGVDCCGKSTQLDKLYLYIKKLDKYQDVLTTREPTSLANEIKKRLQTELDAFSGGARMAYLYTTDRAQHSQEITSYLEQENRKIILCDRYAMSTLGHQGAQGMDLGELWKMHSDLKVIPPDLTIFIDISAKTGIERAQSRGKPLEKFESPEFFPRMVEKYLEIALISEPSPMIRSITGRIVKIDGERDESAVFEDVKKAFHSVYDPWKKSMSS
ncbi:MAG: dTMP kinase [archaeon]